MSDAAALAQQEAAVLARSQGSDAFRAEEYETAVLLYKKALQLSREDDAERHKLLSNCAMAHLKLGQWDDALQAAEQSIAQQKRWAKGYL
jgi:tetratricopeptide (TPR) repeat protein